MKGIGLPRKTLALLAILAFLAYGSGWLSTALAQYPPPIGTVTAAATTAAAPTGASVELTCTVQDSSGAPIANEPCTFTILSQPGTDASIGSLSVTKTTDADGIARATLFTGSTPGVIVVRVEAGGASSQVSVAVGVQPGVAPPTAPPAAPPAGVPPMPAAGLGGTAGKVGGSAANGALAAGALAAAAILAAGACLMLRSGSAR